MLSRACSITNSPSTSENLLTDEADYQIYVGIENLKCSDIMRSKINNETLNDSEMRQVIDYIVNGWPKGPSTKDVRQNLGFSNHPPSPNVRVRIFQFYTFFNFYTFLFLLIKTKFIAQFLFL